MTFSCDYRNLQITVTDREEATADPVRANGEMEMARYIDLTDAAKAKVQRKDAARTDWDAEMLRLEKEAEKVRDVFLGKQADRMVAQLRTEWLAAKRMKHFVETGENIQHRNL